VGTYEWVASYGGDANNNPVSSALGDEPETVIPASPAIVTLTSGTVVIGSGNRLNDSATLSGGFNPTGTLTFTLFDTSNTAFYTNQVTVNGNCSYDTSLRTFPTRRLSDLVGTYEWVASYSGDANNNPVSSALGDEPETVIPASPAIVTLTSGTVVIGSGN